MSASDEHDTGVPAEPIRVLALCGSLRAGSLNAALLRAAAEEAPELLFVGTDLAGRLPLFDADVDSSDELPESVVRWRAAADSALGTIIATPEHAAGPSGVTKNAIDWLVGSGGVVEKPTVLMSASPMQAGGLRAQSAILPTLEFLEAVMVETISVSRAARRFDADGRLTDPITRQRLRGAMAEFTDALHHAQARTQRPLPA